MNNLNVSIFVESETQWIFNKTTCSTLHEKELNEINKTIYPQGLGASEKKKK